MEVMDRMIAIVVMAATILILLSGMTGAGHIRRMDLPIREITVIAPADDLSRQSLLLKPDLSQLNDNTHVLFAVLYLEINYVERCSNNLPVQLELMPLATDWQQDQVSWDYPWRTPGGDVATGCRETFLVRESGQAHFDVTRLLRGWIDATRRDCGVVIRTDSFLGGRFDVDTSLDSRGGNPSIRLSVIVGGTES